MGDVVDSGKERLEAGLRCGHKNLTKSLDLFSHCEVGKFAIGIAVGKDNAIRRYSNGRDDGSQLKGDAYRQGYTDGWNFGRAPSGRDWSPTEGNP